MKKAKKNKVKKINKEKEILLTTTDNMSGYTIVESIGLVQGSTILNLTKIKGIKEYHNKLENARMNSLKKIIAQTRQLDCGAITGIRFEINNISKDLIDVLVYGTSVKIKKK